MWLTQYMEGITLRSKDKYNNKIYYTSDKLISHLFKWGQLPSKELSNTDTSNINIIGKK